MKSRYISVVKGILAIILLIAFYIVFLVIGQLIPKSLIIDNVRESYEQLENEGLDYDLVEGGGWDNFTDSLFLNTAVTEYDGNILQRAMANAYTVSSDESATVLDDLNYALNPDETTSAYAYSRYWAGNVTLYKFLLIFTSIRGIRLLLFIVTMTLLIAVLFKIKDTLGNLGIVSFMVSIFLGMYIPNAYCLVFSTDIIMMLAMMLVCDRKMKRSDSLVSFCWVFGIAGSLLAYLNYWAFPLIILGMPLVYVTVLRVKRKDKAAAIIKDNIFVSISWAVGLCGTVLIKQVIAYAVLGEQTGLGQLGMRMGSDLTMKARLKSVVDIVMGRLSDPLVMAAILVSVVCLLALLWSGKIKRVKGVGAFLIIALYPVIWCFLLAGHSTHGFVKYMYGVTYYALLSAAYVCIEDMRFDLKACRAYMSGKKLVRSVCALCIFIIIAGCFMHKQFFYNEKEYVPWSTEIEGYAELGNGAEVVQEMHIEIEKYNWVQLTGISTMLVNITDDIEGMVNVKIMLGDELIDEAQADIGEVSAGEYFDIPVNAILYLGYNYSIIYSFEGDTDANPYLCIQTESQAVGSNGDLYVNEQLVEGGLVNKYTYKTERISAKSKISMLLLLFFAVQYLLCEGIKKENAYEDR